MPRVGERFHNFVRACRRDPPRAEALAEQLLRTRQPQRNLQAEAEVARELGSRDDTGALAVKRSAVVTGVAQRLIGRVEHHELEGVGQLDLFGWDAVAPPVVMKAVDRSSGSRGSRGALGLPGMQQLAVRR